MIQAADIDGALKVYRLDALDENVLCIRESGIIEAELAQQPTLSREKVSEVLVEQISRFIPITKNTPFIKNSTTAICNLTPAVSDDKLLELLLSENGLDDDRIAKLFKDAMDAAYQLQDLYILEALHEAWEEIKQIKATKSAKERERSKKPPPDEN